MTIIQEFKKGRHCKIQEEKNVVSLEAIKSNEI